MSIETGKAGDQIWVKPIPLDPRDGMIVYQSLWRAYNFFCFWNWEAARRNTNMPADEAIALFVAETLFRIQYTAHSKTLRYLRLKDANVPANDNLTAVAIENLGGPISGVMRKGKAKIATETEAAASNTNAEAKASKAKAKVAKSSAATKKSHKRNTPLAETSLQESLVALGNGPAARTRSRQTGFWEEAQRVAGPSATTAGNNAVDSDSDSDQGVPRPQSHRLRRRRRAHIVVDSETDSEDEPLSKRVRR